MKSPVFVPNRLRYLVLPYELAGESTLVGEYVIEKEKDMHQQPSEGTVVAFGRECSEFALGAKVLFGKYSGYDQLLDGVWYKILQESEILGQRAQTGANYNPPALFWAFVSCVALVALLITFAWFRFLHSL
jgi:co-chaperonin GroES (HSP10)